jgi:hypothetical protein
MNGANMKDNKALCTYRVRQDKGEEFLALLRTHAPTLHRFGLLTDQESPLFRGQDESGKPFFVEILHWKSEEGHKLAEQLPEVLRIWESMGKLVEARLGRPAMEFPFVEEITRA